MRLIVTHPGQAHRDDYCACAILLAHYGPCPVERRDPTPEELDDHNVAVVDVGGRHEPEMLNFDHHQFSRDCTPVCALTLVLRHLELEDQAREAFPWLGFTELLDSKGPIRVAAEFLEEIKVHASPTNQRLMWELIQTTLSPIEAQELRRFGSLSKLLPDSDHFEDVDGVYTFHTLIQNGRAWLNYLRDLQTRTEQLDRKVKMVAIEDLWFVDASFVPRDQDPVLGLETWVKKNYPEAAGTITQDDRGQGLCLFRRNDHPNVDFSRLEGEPGVVFTHKNGFVCKLAAGVDPLPLLRKAIQS